MSQRTNTQEYNSVCSNLFEDSSDDIGVIVQQYSKLSSQQQQIMQQDVKYIAEKQPPYFKNNSNHNSTKYSPNQSVSIYNNIPKSTSYSRSQKQNMNTNTNIKYSPCYINILKNCKQSKSNFKPIKESIPIKKQLNVLNRCMWRQQSSKQLKKSKYIKKQPETSLKTKAKQKSVLQQKLMQRQLKFLLRSIQQDMQIKKQY